jgi:hypothetical protein
LTARRDGEVNWNEVFQVWETNGGTREYVVEEGNRQGAEALEAVGRSLKNLRQMGK